MVGKIEFGENYFDVGYFVHSWLYPVKFTDFIDMHIVRKNDRKFGHGKMGLLYLLIFRKILRRKIWKIAPENSGEGE